MRDSRETEAYYRLEFHGVLGAAGSVPVRGFTLAADLHRRQFIGTVVWIFTTRTCESAYVDIIARRRLRVQGYE